MELLNVGYGNSVAAARILAIVSPEAAPSRRLIQEARDQGRCIDATGGRKTRALLVLDTGHVMLSALQTETLAARLTRGEELPALTIRRPGREDQSDEGNA